ncbi:MAG: hypothetical protein GY851_21535 [bacterium]|nr:hypothetical protein [bacterium]
MASRWKWLRTIALIGLLLTMLFVYFFIVRPVTTYNKNLESYRELAAIPTPESEPQNRASYYMDAAWVVTPTPSSLGGKPEGVAVRHPPEETLAELLKGPERQPPEWDSVAPDVEAFLAVNEASLGYMTQAGDLTDCRMPLLYGPGCPGGSEYAAAEALESVGDVLFWSTIASLHKGDYRAACKTGLTNLRFGADVASLGSNRQATAGLNIHGMASRALAEALTQHRLPNDALALLEYGLPECVFPDSFDEKDVTEHHIQHLRLVNDNSDPEHVRWVRALRLHRIIDIRYYSHTQWGLSPFPTGVENALVSYPSSSDKSFDNGTGLSSGVALLRIGVAVQRHLGATGTLPSSLEDLVPEYLAELPENPVGTPFVVEASDEVFEVGCAGVRSKYDPRALRFELETLRQP